MKEMPTANDRASQYQADIKASLEMLGQAIRDERAKKNITQADLAARIGVTVVTMIRIERGTPTCGIGHVFAALAALRLPLWKGAAAAPDRARSSLAQPAVRRRRKRSGEG